MKKLLVVLLFVITEYTQAQIIVSGYQMQLPLASSIDELWRFNISNASNATIPGRLSITLLSTRGVKIFYAVSAAVAIKPGINSLSSEVIMPINYAFSNNEIASKISASHTLPVGEYRACVNFRKSNDAALPFEFCFEFSISTSALFSLISPFNTEIIETTSPTLTWTPLIEESLEYRIYLAPRNNRLSLKENMLKEILLLNGERVMIPMLFYPPFAAQLERGGEYVWCVKAFRGSEQVATSQIWVFKISPAPKPNSNTDCYRIISPGINSGFYIADHKLKFAYDNRSNQDAIVCYISPVSGSERKSIPISIDLSPGINKIDIDITKLKGAKRSQSYLARIKDSVTEYKLSFTYYKSNR